MSEQTWRWGPPPPDDGITAEQLWPHGWAPGKYLARACDKCSEPHSDCDKRSRKCRPCAVAAFQEFEAFRARIKDGIVAPPALPKVNTGSAWELIRQVLAKGRADGLDDVQLAGAVYTVLTSHKLMDGGRA